MREDSAATVPSELVHLVRYPYANPRLLFQYCLLNGEITETDPRPLLPGVTQPTLLVTGMDDTTVHPDGSRYVAPALPRARLHVVPHGDHISLFQGPPEFQGVPRPSRTHRHRVTVHGRVARVTVARPRAQALAIRPGWRSNPW